MGYLKALRDYEDYEELRPAPERMLLAAVLYRAIHDYAGPNARLAAEAAEWLFGELGQPTFAPFTYPWICEQLDLDLTHTTEAIEKLVRAAAPQRFAC